MSSNERARTRRTYLSAGAARSQQHVMNVMTAHAARSYGRRAPLAANRAGARDIHAWVGGVHACIREPRKVIRQSFRSASKRKHKHEGRSTTSGGHRRSEFSGRGRRERREREHEPT